jgi:phage host-nuclease inhibitor protein Gam
MKLADTRSTTLDDAKNLMGEIRRLTCRRETIVAKYEERIAELTRKAAEDTAEIMADLETSSERLKDFILTHQALFTSPRSVKTDDGQFGLETSTRVKLSDGDTALDHILENGYDDCVKITRTLIKPAIAKRMKRGEQIPGAVLDEGEIAFCRVNKTLIDAARKGGSIQ